MIPPFAILHLTDNEAYEMFTPKIIIGRGTDASPVDVDIGPSSFVSRQHLVLTWQSKCLTLLCNGKNGIFINKRFCPSDEHFYNLPTKCTLRFPSTSICIRVQQCRPNVVHERFRHSRLHHRIYRSRVVGKRHSAAYAYRNRRSPLESRRRLSVSSNDSDVSSVSHLDSLATKSCLQSSTAVQQSRPRRKQALIPSHGSQSVTPTSSEANVTPVQTGISVSSTSITNTIPTCSNDNVPDPQVLQSNLLVAAPLTSSSTNQVFHVTTLPELERGDRKTKPPYSYAQLIGQAILNRPDRQLTLSGIYDYISKTYPFYLPQDKGWQNSVRHNLSLNRYFIKVPRSQEDPGKGCFWRIDPLYEAKLLVIAFRKRRSRGYLPGSSLYYQPNIDIPVSTNHPITVSVPTTILRFSPHIVSIPPQTNPQYFPSTVGVPINKTVLINSTTTTQNPTSLALSQRSTISLTPIHSTMGHTPPTTNPPVMLPSKPADGNTSRIFICYSKIGQSVKVVDNP